TKHGTQEIRYFGNKIIADINSEIFGGFAVIRQRFLDGINRIRERPTGLFLEGVGKLFLVEFHKNLYVCHLTLAKTGDSLCEDYVTIARIYKGRFHRTVTQEGHAFPYSLG